MHPIRKPVAAERPPRKLTAHLGCVETPNWPAMVEGIRGLRYEAALDFKESYRQGVQVFLRRQLGAVGLPQLVEEALEGAVLGIQTGRMAQPADLVHFLRNILERELLIRHLNPSRGLVALAMATDHSRLQRDAGFIQEALVAFTELEQRALRAYYDGALTMAQAGALAGIGENGFSQLRERLYEAVRQAGVRKPPHSATETGVASRALAATSGAG